MAKINTISDGQPFTYQLLNSIIESINEIKEPEDSGDQIDVYGPGLNSNTKPKIIFGKHDVTVPKDQTTFSGTANFQSSFTNDNPIVVATIVDRDEAGGTQLGYLTITSISNKSFKYKIRLMKSRGKDVTFDVNYIAIGVTSK